MENLMQLFEQRLQPSVRFGVFDAVFVLVESFLLSGFCCCCFQNSCPDCEKPSKELDFSGTPCKNQLINKGLLEIVTARN